MKRLVLGFLCAFAFAVAPGCGGDDDDTGDNGDNGGGADAADNAAAEAFCASYSTVCGFTADWYNTEGECVTTFSGWGTERQACVAEHLTFADDADDDSPDEEMHCGHAAGDAPCD
jgi:hypothetical protein